MDVRWAEIPGIPGYLISDMGEVISEKTGRPLRINRNAAGIFYTSFGSNSKRNTRGIAKMVATAFVEQPRSDFNTNIHLDADRSNCKWFNLQWRTRPFAMYYHKEKETSPYVCTRPFKIVETGEIFRSFREASMRYGILERDIYMGVMDGRPSFPIRFHFVEL